MSEQRGYLAQRRGKLGDVAINFAGWSCIPMGLFIVFAIAKAFQVACQLDVSLTVVQFIDYKLFLAQIVGSVVVLGLLAIVRTGALARDWQTVQKRAVTEFFAIFMNFGSLFLVSTLIFLVVSINEVNHANAVAERYVALVNGVLGLGALIACWLLAPVDMDRGSATGEDGERIQSAGQNPPQHDGKNQ